MPNQPDLNELIKKAQEMQENMQTAQEELKNTEFTGESGAGLVKVIIDGRHHVSKIIIDDEVLKEDKEILEDLVAAAVNDAVSKAEETSQNKLSSLTSTMGLPPDFNPFA